MSSAAGLGPDIVRLRDGDTLLVRPIRPEDGEALVALHARLSADSIYRRYFGVRPHLSPGDVHRFTHVDGRIRSALVATRKQDLVAVARYEGRPGEVSAELAVVVDDALQRLGVGRLLLGRLVDIARVAGLTELVAEVLTANRGMLALLSATGLPQRSRLRDEVVRVVLDLSRLELPADRRARALDHVFLAELTAGPADASLRSPSG